MGISFRLVKEIKYYSIDEWISFVLSIQSAMTEIDYAIQKITLI